MRTSILFNTILFLGLPWISLPGGSAWAQTAWVQEKQKPPRGNSVEEPLYKIITTFQAQAQKSLIKESGKTGDGDIAIELTVAPDAAFYKISNGLQEALDSGYQGNELVKKLQRAREGGRSWKDKVLFHIRILFHDDEYQFFEKNKKQFLVVRPRPQRYYHLLQEDLRKHISIKPRPKKYEILDLSPKPEFTTWKVFESSKVRKASLALMGDALTFDLLIPRSEIDEGPLTISFGGFIAQKDIGSHKNGINSASKQISCPSWGDLLTAPISFTFDPDVWKTAAPEGFDTFVKALDSLPKQKKSIKPDRGEDPEIVLGKALDWLFQPGTPSRK